MFKCILKQVYVCIKITMAKSLWILGFINKRVWENCPTVTFLQHEVLKWKESCVILVSTFECLLKKKYFKLMKNALKILLSFESAKYEFYI